MDITLALINAKIKKTQFTKFGLGNMTEYEAVKALVAEILDMAKGKIQVKGKPLTVTMDRLTKKIAEHGDKFAKQAEPLFQPEIYNQFVGDFFELFAEYFFKMCSPTGQYGIVDYSPALTDNGDWGVDGVGTAADEREISGGKTPAVVQVKFRSNPMDEISYTMLAKTGFDGIKNYGLDINRKNNVILFCNTENGANYLAKKALGDNLYVISKGKLDKDPSGIKTVSFWENFAQSI